MFNKKPCPSLMRDTVLHFNNAFYCNVRPKSAGTQSWHPCRGAVTTLCRD